MMLCYVYQNKLQYAKESSSMEERLNYVKAAPAGYRAILTLNRYVDECDLEPLLLELVRMRASQINGCAYCLDMHSKDARAIGETEQRLYALSAWRETPFYTPRERAALRWTEEITLISQDHASDAAYDEARQHFSEGELVNLTLAIIMINSWNRLAIGFRSVPGEYQSSRKPQS
jgi:AhpD family alkylhydroperoxidase